MNVSLIAISAPVLPRELWMMNNAVFLIEGISRTCSHQLVRHRVGSYSQESQRYVEGSDWACIVPPAIADNEKALAIAESAFVHAQHAYEELRALGIRKEDARFVLPEATETRLVMSMTFEGLKHFFELRLARDAQWEIREVARRMLEQLVDVSSGAFDSFRCYLD